MRKGLPGIAVLMRWRILLINSAVLLIVGLLSFVTLRVTLSDALIDARERRSQVERAVRSANFRLELDGRRLQQWLSDRAKAEPVRAVFAAGTAAARSDSARVEARRLHAAARGAEGLGGLSTPLIVFVDARGVAIGRNDSNQMRGENLAASYPALARALESGRESNHVWLNRHRSEQLLASFAPVRDDSGQVVGGLVVGMPLNDERLARVSSATSGQALSIATADGPSAMEVIAEGGSELLPAGVRTAMRTQGVLRRAFDAVGSDLAVFEDPRNAYAAQPLRSFEGPALVLIAGMRQSLVPSLPALLWPLFAATLLGIFLSVAGATYLGNYFGHPIEQLEEGVLAVINGRTDHRFEIEHPLFGGLVCRLNSLLNVFMGIPETDAEGRTSTPVGAPYREFEDR